MALAHQAASQKVPPRLIAVIGASGAGKTVFLGMLLDMLSRQPQRMQLLARGAFSISLQQTTINSLARCEFPQKTSNEPDSWNWVHCQIRRSGQQRSIELIMPDMAGEAVLEEVDHPHTYRVVRAFLRKTIAAMVLIDATGLREGDRNQDYFTMKLLTCLSELDQQRKRGKLKRPIALVFTKTDQAEECRADPAGFAAVHATGVWQHCKERFACHRFFAASVAGGCIWRESLMDGRCQVPLRIEPHGIVEPFEWLLEQLEGKAWTG
jgi:GTPase SAR1 family protein